MTTGFVRWAFLASAVFGAAAWAQPTQRQFDLDCVGTSRWGGQEPTEFRRIFHVDLVGAHFCIDACATQWPIARITPQLIVFGEGVERDQFNTNTSSQVYHPDTRQFVADFVASGGIPFTRRTEAQCEVRPFTPFPVNQQ